MAKAKAKFPATVYVYEAGNQGETYLCITSSLDGIPEDQDGEPIATYGLTRQGKFELKRDIVQSKSVLMK